MGLSVMVRGEVFDKWKQGMRRFWVVQILTGGTMENLKLTIKSMVKKSVENILKFKFTREFLKLGGIFNLP